jgi:hypothetical protein
MDFRKKPVVIQAAQWFKHGDHPAVIRAWDHPEGTTTSKEFADIWGKHAVEFPAVDTLEGLMRVTVGDWIITGIQGEHYPCKPEIFAATYEPAGQPPAPASGSGDAGGERAECTNSDSWNCKYCPKTDTCAALKDPRNFGTPASGRSAVDVDKLKQQAATFRDLQSFHPGHFRMLQIFAKNVLELVASHAPSACQTPSAEGQSATSSATSVAKVEVPKGWQLVPIVPSEPMRKAPWNDTPLAIEPDDASEIWAAMLAAAPRLTP